MLQWSCVFLLWGCYSSWISTSWSDGEQGILSEGDEQTERGNEEKMIRFVEGENGCSIKITLWCIPPFLFMIFSYNMDYTHSPASVHTRPCNSTLLSLCQAEIHTERTKIWVCLGELRKFTGRATQYYKRGIPGMLLKLEEMLRSGGEYFKVEKAQHQQSKWENDLYTLFGIFTDRPRTQKPNYL
jgi:hypothetical protein